MNWRDLEGVRLIELPCAGCGDAVVVGSVGGDENHQGIVEAWAADIVRTWCPKCWPHGEGEVVYGCDVPDHPNNFTHLHPPSNRRSTDG